MVTPSREPRVKDLSATSLIAAVKEWAAPHEIAVGAVVNPFATDLDRELRLLKRKLDAGANFVQSQMVFDLDALREFMERAADLLGRGSLLRGSCPVAQPADGRPCSARLPGCLVLNDAYRQISAGGVRRLRDPTGDGAGEHARRRRLHIYPLGDEEGRAK